MLTCPAARLMMAAGMKNGDILRGPPCNMALCSRSMTSNPPMPEPICTPTRSAKAPVTCRPHLHGLMRGGKSKVDKARHFPRFLLVHKFERIEVLHLGSEGDRKTCRIETGDGGHPALACKQIVPDLRCCVANAAQQPNARDYDAPLQGYLPPFAFFSM